ncbi:MAG: hypothetical protein JWL75_502 [Parcubacteria group bacterium]|nr:hypothetical protein [Parcubacteria group bacterium]
MKLGMALIRQFLVQPASLDDVRIDLPEQDRLGEELFFRLKRAATENRQLAHGHSLHVHALPRNNCMYTVAIALLDSAGLHLVMRFNVNVAGDSLFCRYSPDGTDDADFTIDEFNFMTEEAVEKIRSFR